jgi:hypothetical protein
MSGDVEASVPVWALATEAVSLPVALGEEGMTPARLGELRTVLAALAESPIATLEAHPRLAGRDRSGGIALHASSPLAQQLSQLVMQTSKHAPANVNVAATGETLYRMVVPAKVAAQFGEGLVKPMTAKGVAGGVYGALRDSKRIVANATLVPVTGGQTAVAGAATGSAATAGVTAASAGALTVAAPLVLMAVAVSVSAYADHQRQVAIERITDLLEQLHEHNLEDDRNRLDGCRDAIDKATSVLLDKGRVGLSLGLDSATYAINTAISAASARLDKWQAALEEFSEGSADLDGLKKAFPGVTEKAGEFHAHLELARLAISLKRRVIVLQAVEHAQQDDGDNPFKSFIGQLQDDARRVDELGRAIDGVLNRLSSLEVKRNAGFRIPAFTPTEVDNLLKASYRLRALDSRIETTNHASDVSIEIERNSDGSLVVFPAEAA